MKSLKVTILPPVRYNQAHEFIHCNREDNTQRNFAEKVGLRASNRHDKDATIPFKLTFKMPIPDHGKRGYSDKYVAELTKQLK